MQSTPKLYIGNKNYSSWSFRPWIAMRALNIPFDEELVPFDMAGGNPKFSAFSPTNKVPVLEHNGNKVWESLAIIEYLGDAFPEKSVWPADISHRAHARSISCEMASGFMDLRAACPMNMRREAKPIDISKATGRDVERIVAIWDECLERCGGPFLFGQFTGADAMFAPVVNRLEIYCLAVSNVSAAYMERMKSLNAWSEWRTASEAEPWVVEEDEV